MSSLRQLARFGVHCTRSLLSKSLVHKNPRFAYLHRSKVCLEVNAIEIKMPALSPTMTEGTIVKWLKKEGDTVSPGDVLCEIQTDKAVVGLETEEEGILVKILVPEDSKNVQLGEVIAVIGSEGNLEDFKDYKVKSSTTHTAAAEKPDVHQTPTPPKSAIAERQKPIGPAVKKLLQEYGVEYSLVPPSGPHGMLLKGDVLNFIKINKLKREDLAPEKSEVSKMPDVTFIEKGAYIDIPLTSMRKTIAKRLTESKTTIPHAYINIDCNVSKVLDYRKIFKKDNINVTVNDFVIKSAAVALSKIPKVNVQFLNDQVRYMQSVDISVAVATENGLITPVIRNANLMSIQHISEQVRAFATKAKAGKLMPEEYQGGSFTISNLGMFGITEFS
ncbi:Pyruvate dehydrogenase protein X component, partial [Stegodyphus mimosarum]